VVVSYISSHSCPGADWRKRGSQSAPTAPPTTTIHTHQYDVVHVVMMVGETGGPGVNPHRHEENMQTPHRKDQEQPGRPGFEPRAFLLWGDSANHWATVLPVHGLELIIVGLSQSESESALHVCKYMEFDSGYTYAQCAMLSLVHYTKPCTWIIYYESKRLDYQCFEDSVSALPVSVSYARLTVWI